MHRIKNSLSQEFRLPSVSTVKCNNCFSQSISSPGQPGFGLKGNWPAGQAGTVNEILKLTEQPIHGSLHTIPNYDRRICYVTALIKWYIYIFWYQNIEKGINWTKTQEYVICSAIINKTCFGIVGIEIDFNFTAKISPITFGRELNCF